MGGSRHLEGFGTIIDWCFVARVKQSCVYQHASDGGRIRPFARRSQCETKYKLDWVFFRISIVLQGVGLVQYGEDSKVHRVPCALHISFFMLLFPMGTAMYIEHIHTVYVCSLHKHICRKKGKFRVSFMCFHLMFLFYFWSSMPLPEREEHSIVSLEYYIIRQRPSLWEGQHADLQLESNRIRTCQYC